MDGITKSSAKTVLFFLAVSSCVFLFSGCYTQLMKYHGETMQGRAGGACDDGCPDEVAANSARREICVWERDIFGYPEMRCYNTLYHSSWMYFHSTPWWYRNSFGWYDTRGCPPNYYYDRYTGSCRRYGHTYPPANSGIGGGGGGPVLEKEPAPPRRNPRAASSAAAESAPVPSSSGSAPMFNEATFKTLSPASAPAQPSTSAPTPSASTPASQPPMAKPQEEQGNQAHETQAPAQPKHEPQEAPARRNMRGGR